MPSQASSKERYCCQSVVAYLWVIGLRLGADRLTTDCPIPLFDFFDDDPSQVSHALALNFDHRFGDFFDELCFCSFEKTPSMTFTVVNGI